MNYADKLKERALSRLAEKGVGQPDFSNIETDVSESMTINPDVELMEDRAAIDNLQILRSLRDQMPEEAYRNMFDRLSKQLYKENRFKKLIQD